MRAFVSVATALAMASLLACASDESGSNDATTSDVVLNGDFVAIPRQVDAQTMAARHEAMAVYKKSVSAAWAAPGEDFYLAIKKNALGQKWFLSAFLQQYFPGGVNAGAAASLGTRVVTFKVQNDRLYVFDVDDRKASSDIFDPELLVEAYPIITGWKAFEILPGASNYVLIDPASGLNRFGVVGDALGSGAVGGDYTPHRFQVELSYLQRFRKIADGVTYEQVFTGYSDDQLPGDGIEPNPFRASGTLGIALRHYHEGDHYSEVPMPGQELYFRGDWRRVKNTGNYDAPAARWDLYPGMTPIKWYITKSLADLDATMPQFDLVDAVKRGIEGWNDALGFTAFTAEVAGPGDNFADDDKNFVIFDPDPSLGYAFANWRTNPNTGEIRGASVYLGRGWILDDYFPPDAGSGDGTGDVIAQAARLAPAKEKHPVTRLVWDALPSDTLCAYWAPSYRNSDGARIMHEAGLTQKESVEKYLTHAVTHEIGHTLGLRHNFKGTLVPPTSSVMDYSPTDIRLLADHPGSYDVAAVEYLYGQSTDLPAEPFCTDGDYYSDPECGVFDEGADPLWDFHAPDFDLIADYVLLWGLPADLAGYYLDYYGVGILGFVRNGDSWRNQPQSAWQHVMERVAAPVDPSLLAGSPYYGEGADAIATWVLRQLFLDPPSPDAYITDPVWDPSIISDAVDQARQILSNVNGIRSVGSRRAMVDLLKKQQTEEAFLALRDARDAVDAEIATAADPAQAALLEDLEARIDAALSPYFE